LNWLTAVQCNARQVHMAGDPLPSGMVSEGGQVGKRGVFVLRAGLRVGDAMTPHRLSPCRWEGGKLIGSVFTTAEGKCEFCLIISVG